MAAKDRHRANIIKYLADWDNEWPKRIGYAAIMGVKIPTIWRIFTSTEIDEIEEEGLALRKKNAAVPRAAAYKALVRQFDKGNVPAIKEFLERTEGKVLEKKEVSFPDILTYTPEEQAELKRLALQKARLELKQITD